MLYCVPTIPINSVSLLLMRCASAQKRCMVDGRVWLCGNQPLWSLPYVQVYIFPAPLVQSQCIHAKPTSCSSPDEKLIACSFGLEPPNTASTPPTQPCGRYTASPWLRLYDVSGRLCFCVYGGGFLREVMKTQIHQRNCAVPFVAVLVDKVLTTSGMLLVYSP